MILISFILVLCVLYLCVWHYISVFVEKLLVTSFIMVDDVYVKSTKQI